MEPLLLYACAVTGAAAFVFCATQRPDAVSIVQLSLFFATGSLYVGAVMDQQWDYLKLLPAMKYPILISVFSKCLPIIILSIFVGMVHRGQAKVSPHGLTTGSLMVRGLVACFVGDALLELESGPFSPAVKDGFFVGGILAFLLGHVMYIRALAVMNARTYGPGTPVLTALGKVTLGRLSTKGIHGSMGSPLALNLMWLIPTVYSAWFYSKLWSHLDMVLRGAVGIYVTAITIMFIFSNQGVLVPLKANLMAWLGALSFVASDSVLAWNRFISPHPCASTVVMVTYYAGQLGLAMGTVLFIDNLAEWKRFISKEARAQ